jgi:hypothetical protein
MQQSRVSHLRLRSGGGEVVGNFVMRHFSLKIMSGLVAFETGRNYFSASENFVLVARVFKNPEITKKIIWNFRMDAEGDLVRGARYRLFGRRRWRGRNEKRGVVS